MIFKLRTSKETQEIFETINQTTGLQPFALSKIAIALSIRDKELNSKDFETDNDGLELNRQTITGENDLLFKALIINELDKSITDEEYFPKYLKAHLDRGAKLLANEYKYNKNILDSLCNLDNNLWFG